jgi:hypothetical protein
MIKYGNIALTTTIILHIVYHLCQATAIVSTSGRLHSEFVRLLFLQAHRETDRFFAGSGVQFAQSTSGLFHLRRVAFTQQLKSRVGLVLVKEEALRITLNFDGAVRPSHLNHTLTHHTPKLLVY